jgi:hypothetical protein
MAFISLAGSLTRLTIPIDEATKAVRLSTDNRHH